MPAESHVPCPVCTLVEECRGLDLGEAIALLTRFTYLARCTDCGAPWAAHLLEHPHCRTAARRPGEGLWVLPLPPGEREEGKGVRE